MSVVDPPRTRSHAKVLFAALEERGLRHAVWKDLDEVDAFWRGDSELDVLVDKDDRESFRRLAAEHCFAEYRNRVDVYEGRSALHLQENPEGLRIEPLSFYFELVKCPFWRSLFLS